MKKYNVQNYIRFKNDLLSYEKRPPLKNERTKLIVAKQKLVENIARKFSTTQQASGVLNILDLLQEGNVGLIQAVDKVDWKRIIDSDDPERSLNSFLSKRIKGAIRRAIDINRGNIRIPEHKLNDIRKNSAKEQAMVQTFFNSVFLSIDSTSPDTNMKEYDVLRMSYGLDCDKMSAKQIAGKLQIEGTASYVRISQIKRDAINKLIETVDPAQVADLL